MLGNKQALRMKFLITLLLFVTLVLAEESMTKEELTTVKADEATTVPGDIDTSTEAELIEINTEVNKPSVDPTSTSPKPIDSTEDSSEESGQDDDHFPMPTSNSQQSQKRKILYINQQQHGKLNVQFELNDVSLIVIPASKDPQLSLLNLLLKSAQKSSLMSEQKKKEGAIKVKKDDYSKYNFMHTSTNEPSIESRAPYKVDISSTLNSQPIIEITHPSDEVHMTASPMLKVKKPIVFQSPLHNKAKRSIENNSVGKENEINAEAIPISEEDIINSINETDNIDEFNTETVTMPEFMLLGATENCGPGRKRNSYQICVPVAD